MVYVHVLCGDKFHCFGKLTRSYHSLTKTNLLETIGNHTCVIVLLIDSSQRDIAFMATIASFCNSRTQMSTSLTFPEPIL